MERVPDVQKRSFENIFTARESFNKISSSEEEIHETELPQMNNASLSFTSSNLQDSMETQRSDSLTELLNMKNSPIQVNQYMDEPTTVNYALNKTLSSLEFILKKLQESPDRDNNYKFQKITNARNNIELALNDNEATGMESTITLANALPIEYTLDNSPNQSQISLIVDKLLDIPARYRNISKKKLVKTVSSQTNNSMRSMDTQTIRHDRSVERNVKLKVLNCGVPSQTAILEFKRLNHVQISEPAAAIKYYSYAKTTSDQAKLAATLCSTRCPNNTDKIKLGAQGDNVFVYSTPMQPPPDTENKQNSINYCMNKKPIIHLDSIPENKSLSSEEAVTCTEEPSTTHKEESTVESKNIKNLINDLQKTSTGQLDKTKSVRPASKKMADRILYNKRTLIKPSSQHRKFDRRGKHELADTVYNKDALTVQKDPHVPEDTKVSEPETSVPKTFIGTDVINLSQDILITQIKNRVDIPVNGPEKKVPKYKAISQKPPGMNKAKFIELYNSGLSISDMSDVSSHGDSMESEDTPNTLSLKSSKKKIFTRTAQLIRRNRRKVITTVLKNEQGEHSVNSNKTHTLPIRGNINESFLKAAGECLQIGHAEIIQPNAASNLPQRGLPKECRSGTIHSDTKSEQVNNVKSTIPMNTEPLVTQMNHKGYPRLRATVKRATFKASPTRSARKNIKMKELQQSSRELSRDGCGSPVAKDDLIIKNVKFQNEPTSKEIIAVVNRVQRERTTIVKKATDGTTKGRISDSRKAINQNHRIKQDKKELLMAPPAEDSNKASIADSKSKSTTKCPNSESSIAKNNENENNVKVNTSNSSKLTPTPSSGKEFLVVKQSSEPIQIEKKGKSKLSVPKDKPNNTEKAKPPLHLSSNNNIAAGDSVTGLPIACDNEILKIHNINFCITRETSNAHICYKPIICPISECCKSFTAVGCADHLLIDHSRIPRASAYPGETIDFAFNPQAAKFNENKCVFILFLREKLR